METQIMAIVENAKQIETDEVGKNAECQQVAFPHVGVVRFDEGDQGSEMWMKAIGYMCVENYM